MKISDDLVVSSIDMLFGEKTFPLKYTFMHYFLNLDGSLSSPSRAITSCFCIWSIMGSSFQKFLRFSYFCLEAGVEFGS